MPPRPNLYAMQRKSDRDLSFQLASTTFGGRKTTISKCQIVLSVADAASVRDGLNRHSESKCGHRSELIRTNGLSNAMGIDALRSEICLVKNA